MQVFKTQIYLDVVAKQQQQFPPMFLFHIYSLSQTKKEAWNYIENNWEQTKNGTSTSPSSKCLLHVQ